MFWKAVKPDIGWKPQRLQSINNVGKLEIIICKTCQIKIYNLRILIAKGI